MQLHNLTHYQPTSQHTVSSPPQSVGSGNANAAAEAIAQASAAGGSQAQAQSQVRGVSLAISCLLFPCVLGSIATNHPKS
jgi:hypothetical protein